MNKANGTGNKRPSAKGGIRRQPEDSRAVHAGHPPDSGVKGES